MSRSPVTKNSYSASLLKALKSNKRAYSIITPSKLARMSLMLHPWTFEVLSRCIIQNENFLESRFFSRMGPQILSRMFFDILRSYRGWFFDAFKSCQEWFSSILGSHQGWLLTEMVHSTRKLVYTWAFIIGRCRKLMSNFSSSIAHLPIYLKVSVLWRITFKDGLLRMTIEWAWK